jgi:PAS domain S-box-containing protein
MPNLVRVDRCAILAYDEGSREFRTLASFERGAERSGFDDLRISESEIPSLAHRLNALRLPALLKASPGDASLSPALQARLSMTSALVVPLASRGRFLGLLWLDDTRAHHYFTSEEINIVQGVAAQIAIALDRANLADRLEAERRRSESLVATLLEGLIIVDRDGRIVTIDGGAEALVGWQASEVRGRRFRDVFSVPEAEAGVPGTRADAGPSAAPKTMTLRAREGALVDCAVRIIPVRNDRGEVFQVLYALQRPSEPRGRREGAVESTHRPAGVQPRDLPE